jgi:hypothetical protein
VLTTSGAFSALRLTTVIAVGGRPAFLAARRSASFARHMSQVLYREEYQQRPQRGQEGIDIVGAIAEIVGAREAFLAARRSASFTRQMSQVLYSIVRIANDDRNVSKRYKISQERR